MPHDIQNLSQRARKDSRAKLALLLCIVALFISWATAGAEQERAHYMQYVRNDPKLGIVTGHGTAFPVDENTLFTAAHNILNDAHEPLQTLRVNIAGSWVPARALRWDRELDIALLHVDVKLQPLPLAKADPVEGEAVEFVGSLKGTPVAVYRGFVEKRWHGATARSLARVRFDHGLSGCPVISREGVVGVAVCGIPKDGDLDKELGLFIPVSIIRWFIQQTRKDGSHGKENR